MIAKSRNPHRRSRSGPGVLVLAFAVALSGALLSTQAVAEKPDKFAVGRILVKGKAGLSEEKLKKLLERQGAKSKGKIRGLGVHIVEVPAQAEEAVARALANNPNVEFAEVDASVKPQSLVPNDPYYANAWHLPKISAPAAWDLTRGEGVVVAVLDTGVDPSHPDLAGKLVPGWNSYSQNTVTADVNGHGTIVAGAIAAESNNALGVASVAWNASLMPIRITDDPAGNAYWSEIAPGLVWAADHGAKVANISYWVVNSSTVASAARYMSDRGGVVVVAAGNSGDDTGNTDDTGMIAVSATTSSDSKASWSSIGDHVDLAAPGVGIWTTTRGGGYGAKSGTSLSSPTAAAVAALVMSANPSLTPAEVEAVLEESADDLGSAGWDRSFGHGRVNAAAAVQLAMSATTIDTLPPTVDITTPTAGEAVSDEVMVAVSASDNLGVSSVRLYAEGALIGTDTLSPYEFSWDSTAVQDGVVMLEARAFDAAGNQGQSSPVSVEVQNVVEEPVPDEEPATDSAAPTVVIHSPSEGTSVAGTVTISASADDDTGIELLSVYVDGRLRCAVNAKNVSCGWNTRKVSAGEYTISVTAEDTAGRRTTRSIGVVKEGGSTSPNRGKGRNK